MPKLYEYFGIIVMFYSNEHEHVHVHVHVHGNFQGRESRAEIVLSEGLVQEILYTCVAGRDPLGANELRFFQEIVTLRANEIVIKWIDYFVLHKSITSERITKRLK